MHCVPCCRAQLMPESLFLTINLIDRYLAARQVTRKNLQLVRLTMTGPSICKSPLCWLRNRLPPYALCCI
jgi:Cyclin, N-terminal domain